MTPPRSSIKKLTKKAALELIAKQKKAGKKIVFTNGCYDLIHEGHVRFLRQAASYGDVLVLGLNSDASIKRLKGSRRPILKFAERQVILSELRSVDYVISFSQDTPLELIKQVRPHVLVKGGDWKPNQIVGADVVKSYGGKVISGLFVKGRSTTSIVKQIQRK